MKGVTVKKAILRFFSGTDLISHPQKFQPWALADPPFTFFAHISKIFDKYHMLIFFIEYLGSLPPVD